VETPYKADEGGHYEYATELVKTTQAAYPNLPVAVTSYGGYKTSIDFQVFALARWPILAQVYDSFQPGDELTYTNAPGGVYLISGVHRLYHERRLLMPGEAVYRPESL